MHRKEQPFPVIWESIRTLSDLFYIFSHEKSMDEYSKIYCSPQLFLSDFLGMNTDTFSFGGRLKQPPHCSALQSQFYNIYTLKSIRKTLKHSQNCHRSIPFLTYLSYCPSPLLFFRQSTPHFFSVVRNEKS